MKKIFILFISILLLTGCNNEIEIDFDNDIQTKINLSFSLNDYNKYTDNKLNNEELKMLVESIYSEARPINDSYDELFKINKSNIKGNNYDLEYGYNYTYSNFKNNALFKRCFDNAVIEDDNNKIYVYLYGESKCGPFKLKIKSNDRMLNNNSDETSNNEYIWNVKEDNNEIRFNISKSVVDSKKGITSNVILIIISICIIIFAFILKNKNKRQIMN